MEFEVVDVPQNRFGGSRGKWVRLVAQLKELPSGKAVSVPLNGRSRVNVGAAILASCQRVGVKIATSQVGDSLLVWKKEDK